MARLVLALSGGVGGAKLAWGLAQLLPPDQLAFVVNTGDDEEFHGLYVSPDLDILLYTLAGIVDPEKGWGIKGDTFHTLELLERYGEPTWFRLGDRDLATHILRTRLLRQGWSLTQIARHLAQRLGVQHEVVPMTDGRLRTIVLTEEGNLPFQEYFVRRACQPRAKGFRYQGAETAHPSPPFDRLLDEASAILFCPSNPYLSLGPILALPGVRQRIASFHGPRLAVSPIVGGEALKGPLAKLLQELEGEASCLSVARLYQGLCDIFILDEVDRAWAPQVERLGFRVSITPTVMVTDADRVALARHTLSLLGW